MYLFQTLSTVSLLFAAFSFSFPHHQITKRLNDIDQPKQLLGDLLTIGVTTPLGQSVQNLLLGLEKAESQVTTPTKQQACDAKSPCCIWYDVSDALTKLFFGRTGLCNDAARAAIRLGFHDAGTWSKNNSLAGMDFGGADGSLLMNFGEEFRSENNGLQGILVTLRKVQKKYKVGFADLVQFAATHATVTCPMGPRIRTFVGRKDATQAAPNGLLPSVNAPANDLIQLFTDKTFDAHMLTALVGAHSCSRQFTQDLTNVRAAQDSTPGIWDVRFYNETIQSPPRKKLFIFKSDQVLFAHPDIKVEWNMFINDQSHWNEVCLLRRFFFFVFLLIIRRIMLRPIYDCQC